MFRIEQLRCNHCDLNDPLISRWSNKFLINSNAILKFKLSGYNKIDL